MPSTHVSLAYHVVFSTKNRDPLIARPWRARLHSMLGGCIRTAGGVNHDTLRMRAFAWQEGYGAFTVNTYDCDGLRKYIASQEEHHRARTFQEEYREFLERHGVEFDERYLW